MSLFQGWFTGCNDNYFIGFLKRMVANWYRDTAIDISGERAIPAPAAKLLGDNRCYISMKYITLGCLAISLLAACSSPADKTAGTDTVINNDTLAKAKTTPANNNTPTVYSLCFLKTQGKDSTSIELVVHGDTVTGQMNWLPYQKDSRKGTLNGMVRNDTIRATWSFMQEGMKDTLRLNFLFRNSQLAQKPLKLNVKTGRDQTDESAGYTVNYNASAKLKH